MEHDKHIIAIYHDRNKADRALEDLQISGFASKNLSLMVSQSGRDHHFEVDDSKSKTAEGVGYGGVLGALVAGLGTAAAGIASVAIPGGIFISGPLVVALAAGSAGAAVGGLTGGLIGLGIPSDEVNLVEAELKEGSIIVAAHSIDESQEKIARQIFKNTGAARIH